MLDDDGHGDLRVVVGGEADEQAVLRLVAAQLGGAGLGAGGDHAAAEGVVHGAAGLGVAQHALLHRLQRGGGDGDGADRLGAAHRQDLRAVIGLDGLEQVGLQQLPAGDQGGDIVGDLQGGVVLVALAEGRPGGPVLALRVLRQGAGVVADLDAGGPPQAEGVQVLQEGVHPQAVAHLREEVVAGLGDGLRHVQAAVVAAGAVDVAAGGVVGVVPSVRAAETLRGGGDGPLLQRRHGGEGLEGGAGGVMALGGPVVEGPAGVGVQGGVDRRLAEGGQVIGGIGGHGQHLPGVDVQHHGGAAPLVVGVGPVHLLDGGRQGVLHRLLQVQVHRQLHGGAGHRLGGVVLAGDLAVLVHGHHPDAVGAPEVVLEGGLRAAAADLVVHGVALVRQGAPVVVSGGDVAHIPQDMGGIGRLVLPDGGGRDLGAGVGAVVEQGDGRRVDILRQHIGVGVGEVAAADLVLDPQHHAGLQLAELRGQGEVVPHELDQAGGGDAGPLQHGARQLAGAQLLQQGGGPFGVRVQVLVLQDVVGGVLPLPVLVHGLQQGGMVQEIRPQGVRRLIQILQVGEEAAFGRVVQGVQRVGEGRGPGDGQVVLPGDPLVPAQLQQPEDGLAGVLVLPQQGGVEGQVVGGAAGHQHLSVPVRQVAPGGLHRLRPGDIPDGAGVVVFIVRDLGVVQHPQIQRHHGEEQRRQDVQPEMVLFLVVHGALLFSRPDGSGGRQRRTAAPPG